MSHLIRLRISLADRAGALAQAATVVGLHGGNIIAIDVHRTDGEAAIDDLVVDFSSEPHVEDLRHDLATDAATTLMSLQASTYTDLVVASMERVVKLLEARPGESAAASAAGLADAVADLCSSRVAWVSGMDEAVRYDAGRAALDRSEAVVRRTTQLPERFAARLPGEVCLVAVPVTEGLGGARVLFVARPVTSEFTAMEIARIEALTHLYREIERLVTPTGKTS